MARPSGQGFPKHKGGLFGNFGIPSLSGFPKFPKSPPLCFGKSCPLGRAILEILEIRKVRVKIFWKFWILFFTSQVRLLCSVSAPPSYMHMCSIIPLFRGHPRALSCQSPHRTRTITILGANMTSQYGEASLSKYTPAYTNVHKYTYHCFKIQIH